MVGWCLHLRESINETFNSLICLFWYIYRLAANALQGMMFSVVWRYLEESQILFGGK